MAFFETFLTTSEPSSPTSRPRSKTVRSLAERQLAESSLTICGTVRVVPEQAAAGCGPGLGALVSNPTTVAAIEAARRDKVVELGTPAESIAELNRDY